MLSKDQINKELAELNLVWIDGEYKNLDSILMLKCNECGGQIASSLKNIRRKQKNICANCMEKLLAIETQEKLKSLPKKKGERILSLDNATLTTGFAILEEEELMLYGVHKEKDADIFTRIYQNTLWLEAMLEQYNIDYLVLEDTQLQRDPQVFKKLSMLLGALVMVAKKHSIPYCIISATEWKSRLGIRGKTRNEQKANSQRLVLARHGVSVSQDEADAICVAKAGWLIKRTQTSIFAQKKSDN